MIADVRLQSSHILCWSFRSKPQNTLLANESSPRQVLHGLMTLVVVGEFS